MIERRLMRKPRLTYANVMSTVGVFIALGGTSYAVTQLPRNSVGPQQIRSGAVGASELRREAVSSRAVRDRSLTLRDIAPSSRESLRGQQGAQGPRGEQGPPGIVLSAAINSAGVASRGNATSAGLVSEGVFTVGWSPDVSGCQAAATLAAVPGGAVTEPPAGRITVRSAGRLLEVRTFDADGSPRSLPFNVLVGC